MTNSAKGMAVFDVLMQRVPELLKIKDVKQQNRLVNAIIKGLVEADEAESRSNTFKVDTTYLRENLKEVADRVIGGDVAFVSRPGNEDIVIMSRVDYDNLVRDLIKYRLKECREHGVNESVQN